MEGQSVLLAAGSNSGGQLGLGHEDDAHSLQASICSDGSSFPPRGYSVVDLSSGSNHTVAIIASEDGSRQIWASGSGTEGQLGRTLTETITSYHQLDLQDDIGLASILPTGGEVGQWRPIRVACGWTSTFIAFECTSEKTQADDVLVVLGKSNDFGQLGLGERRVMQSSVARVVLPPRDEPLQGRMRISDIACGLRYTLVKCEYPDGQSGRGSRVRLYGWGAARLGQLSIKTAIQWEPHLLDEWTSSGKGPTFIGAGKEHTVYYDGGRNHLDDGSKGLLRCLGSNRQGQLHVCHADTGVAVRTAGCTWNATLLFLQDNTIMGSGNNSKGQLGGTKSGGGDIAKWHLSEQLPASCKGGRKRLRSAVCGSEHVLAIVGEEERSSGADQVWGWGWNEHGNLAQGDELDRTSPVLIFPPATTLGDQQRFKNCRPTQIWAGCGTSFIQVARPTGASESNTS